MNAIPAATLEPNELWPGIGKMAAVSVYTSHRSCGNYEFRESPDSLGWDASLYSHKASIEIHFDKDTARSILIVIFLASEDDGRDLFRSLTEERNRDLGRAFLSNPDSADPHTVIWNKDDHVVRLERWPATPRGEIHITRTFSR